jgi:hypothetical protein
MVSFANKSPMEYFDNNFTNDLKEGVDYYMENGYRVMTEHYLIKRGYCCSNGCRHCPYWPKAQKGNTVLRMNAFPGPSKEEE